MSTTSVSRRLRLFLCHASEDKPTVREIYKRLQTYNIELWFDEKNLLAGQRWEDLIPDVIQQCDIVLVCLSRTFLVKEGYGHYEVHLVLEAAKKKPLDTIYHIPLRLDDCEVPAHLAKWHYISYFIPGDFEKIIASCEARRTWLNTHHQANIEPLHFSSDIYVVEPEPLNKDVSNQNTIEAGVSGSDYNAPFSLAGDSHGKRASSQHTSGTLVQRYNHHGSWVLSVDWEPDGTRIASAGADGTVRIWDAMTGASLLTYQGHTSPFHKVNVPAKVSLVAWSPQGKLLASAGDGTEVHVWNSATGQTQTRYHHSGWWASVPAFAWSSDGRKIASVCSRMEWSKTIHVWDALTGDSLKRYDAGFHWFPDFSVLPLAWSPDGTRLAVACGDKTIHIWLTTQEKLVAKYPFHTSCVNHLAWSSNNLYLASAHPDHTIQIWDMNTRTRLRTYYEHRDSVRWIAWSPDRRHIATASNDKTVHIWEALSAIHLYTYTGHTDRVTSVSWSPDGKYIASSSNDQTVHIWQVTL